MAVALFVNVLRAVKNIPAVLHFVWTCSKSGKNHLESTSLDFRASTWIPEAPNEGEELLLKTKGSGDGG